MNPERWQQIDRIFAAALELSASERPDFLVAACGSDGPLRNEVEDLLAAEEEAQEFLAEPLARGEPYQMLAQLALAGPGGRVGSYRLIRVLGHGGMATVYLAISDRDASPRQVAVKLCRFRFAIADVRRRFQIEHQVLARLRHPNIAQLYGGGVTEDGRPYLLLEYIDGVPIDQHCDQRRLSLRERLVLFCQLCSAVDYAHRHRLVHRDLKPGNVLVTREGEVKLLDFGIAKLLDPQRFALSPDPTASGSRVLTPGYASPEQIRSEPITQASDVYSLGILLFELLAGSSPYHLKSHSFTAIERAICEQEPERMGVVVGRNRGRARSSLGVSRSRGLADPRQLRRLLRGDLETIVAEALHKEPAGRYRSVAALSKDIRCHLLGQPISARPRPRELTAGRFLRQRLVGGRR